MGNGEKRVTPATMASGMLSPVWPWLQKAPGCAAFRVVSKKTRKCADWLAVDAVCCEPLYAQIPAQQGNNREFRAKSDHQVMRDSMIMAPIQWVRTEYLSQRTGNFSARNRDFWAGNREAFGESRDPA